MPVPLIPIALALASAIPEITELIAGDKAGRVAEGVVDLAKSVTGHDDPQVAVAAIKDSPVLTEEMAKALYGYKTALAQEQTKQIAEINTTMRDEGESADPWRRRWRPFWGYISAATFAIQMIIAMGIGAWAVITTPYQAPEIINTLAQLIGASMPLWALVTAVVGVAMVKRSDDKARSRGIDPPTIGAGIAKRLFKFEGSAAQ